MSEFQAKTSTAVIRAGIDGDKTITVRELMEQFSHDWDRDWDNGVYEYILHFVQRMAGDDATIKRTSE